MSPETPIYTLPIMSSGLKNNATSALVKVYANNSIGCEVTEQDGTEHPAFITDALTEEAGKQIMAVIHAQATIAQLPQEA